MKEINLVTKIRVYSYNELTDADKNLVDLAKSATQRAYSPYSRFNVGAALLLANGEIVTGSNQENVAFPSGTCAERTTCFYAHSSYPGVRFVKLAIAAFHNGAFTPHPVSPCGACRQVLAEYERIGGAKLEIILYGADEIYVLSEVSHLLPLIFHEDL
ncbi:MAG: cytidine deaminase [Muribaculaceae bacterium]